MARISDAELERLKKDVSLEQLVRSKGVELVKKGDGLHGLCPFHPDRSPSLVVTPKVNLFRCFGCGAAGTTIDWVMKAQGVTFRHAVELLREGADLSGPVGPRRATVPVLPCPLDGEADDAVLLGQVADYYHSTLRSVVEAWAYLEKRGLRNEELIHHFKLGFANRTLGLRLPAADRAAGEKLRGKLAALGVLRSNGHELMTGSLVVPLFDEGGRAVGMYGRKVHPRLRAGTALHLYLPGPHRAAFNSKALAGQRTAIVCEALFDALSFWAAGFRNVTATYGVEGFTAHHLEALKRHGVREVLIAFDRDDAGDAGAEALSKKLLAEGFQCWRVQFPRGMDANEYAVKVQPAAKSLAVALRQATWMGKGSAPGAVSFEAAAASPLTALPALRAEVASSQAVPGAVEGKKSELGATVVEISPVAAASAPAAGARSAPAAAPPVAAPATPALLPVQPKAPQVQAEVSDEEVVLNFPPRRYRVRGLSKALSAEALKVNVLVSQGEAFHVDTLDMYSARQRAAFLRAAADVLFAA